MRRGKEETYSVVEVEGTEGSEEEGKAVVKKEVEGVEESGRGGKRVLGKVVK